MEKYEDNNEHDIVDFRDAYQVIRMLDNAFGDEPQPEKRTEEEYQKLQDNIVLYKQGNMEAGTYIVTSFHRFITKYARFICLGHVPRFECLNKRTGKMFLKVDQNITSFVGLYISAQTKEEFPSKQKRFAATCSIIKDMFSKYDYADIYNELVLALLNMACRYKITKEGDQFHKKNGTFPMYVQKCFHWEAKRRLDKLVDDKFVQPVNFMYINDFNDDAEPNIIEECIEDESASRAFEETVEMANRDVMIRDSSKLTMKETEKINVYSDEALNFNWTNGVTCSELFAELTSFEREILVLSFIKKQSTEQIGHIYGYHKTTINKYKNKAIAKLKKQSEKLKIRIWE